MHETIIGYDCASKGVDAKFILCLSLMIGSSSGEHGRRDICPAAWQIAADEEWFTSPWRACLLHHLSCRPLAHQTDVSTETDTWHCWWHQWEVSNFLTLCVGFDGIPTELNYNIIFLDVVIISCSSLEWPQSSVMLHLQIRMLLIHKRGPWLCALILLKTLRHISRLLTYLCWPLLVSTECKYSTNRG